MTNSNAAAAANPTMTDTGKQDGNIPPTKGEQPLTRSTTIRHPGGPVNLAPSDTRVITQWSHICAAGEACKELGTLLDKFHRCIGCGFSLHPACGATVVDSKDHMVPTITANHLCYPCTSHYRVRTQVRQGKLNMCHAKVRKIYDTIGQWIPLQFLADDDKADFSTIGDEGTTAEEGEWTPVAARNKKKRATSPSVVEQSPASKQRNSQAESMDVSTHKSGEAQEQDTFPDTNVVHMEEEESVDTAKQGRDKEKTADKQSQPKTAPPNSADKVYCDLHITIKGVSAGASITEGTQAISNACKKFMKEMQSVDPTFKLHSWDPDAKEQLTLHSINAFPDNLAELKTFFKGARPIPDGGKSYLKVLISVSKRQVSSLLDEVQWYFRGRKEHFNRASIQAPYVVMLGWLLYSTRQMDADTLAKAISTRARATVSLRWMRINDGSKFDKTRNTKDDPRALHVECAQQNEEQVADTLRTIYGSLSTKFPLKVRLRFVPAFTNLVNINSMSKFHDLRNRQAGWCLQVMTKRSEDFINIDKVAHNRKTLRTMIMKLPSHTGNTKTPLFSSIDAPFRGSGFNIQFHPKKAQEATMTIKGLYTRLCAEYEEETIKGFFTPQAIRRARDMTYDIETGRISSTNDTEVADILGADDDMDCFTTISAITASTALSSGINDATSTSAKSTLIYQDERSFGTSDSVSTFGSKKPRRTKATSATDDNASQASSITDNTGRSSLTAGTRQELAIMKANMQNMQNLLIQISNNQNNANAPNPSVTSGRANHSSGGNTAGDLNRSLAQG